MRTLLRLLAWFAAILPLGVALAVGRAWGFLLGRILRLRRAEMLERLAWALPGTSPGGRERVVNRMYANHAMTVVESLRMAVVPTSVLRPLVEDNGVLEAMRRELGHGRGLLVVCAHLGNWEMLAAATSASGLDLGIVVKDLKPAALNDFVTGLRVRHGTRVFPRKGSMRSAIRHVRDGGILGFMMDQNTKRQDGVFVDFLGRAACTTPGLAQFAVLTGAPTLPVFIVRQPGGRHRMIHGGVFAPPADLSEPEVLAYTQKTQDAVASAVRAHPDQWIWMHRRWRTQPLPDESLPTPPVQP